MPLQVFISYKSEYRDFARAVKNRIREWGYGTWFDVDDIAEGTYFRHAIQEGLEKSEVMVGLLTADAFRSREVQAEWDYFFIKNKEFIPLRYQEVEPPYHLLTIQYIDFIKDEAAAFEKLHKRLGELAAALQKEAIAPSVPGAVTNITTETGAFGGEAIEEKPDPEPEAEEAATPDKKRREAQADDELVVAPPPLRPPPKPITPAAPPDEQPADVDEKHKQEVLEDGLFSTPPAKPIAQPAAPEPIPQPIGGVQAPTNAPATPAQRQPYTSPMQQPASRAKSSPILRPLAAVASVVIVIGIVTLIAVNTNLTISTAPSDGGTIPLLWVGLVALLGVVGVGLWYRFARPQSKTTPYTHYENKRENEMLALLDNSWETRILQSNLRQEPLEFDLTAAPGAVLRHKAYGDYQLPQTTYVLDVLNDANRELLILAARSTRQQLLLQLTYELSQLTQQGVSSAIPIIFNLSAWDDQLSLTDWLTDQLNAKYGLPASEAAAWIEQQKLVLLLDGLDETVEWYKTSCIEALNTFRQQHPKVDWVLCSRIDDFDLLTTHLDVSTAIIVPENNPTPTPSP